MLYLDRRCCVLCWLLLVVWGSWFMVVADPLVVGGRRMLKAEIKDGLMGCLWLNRLELISLSGVRRGTYRQSDWRYVPVPDRWTVGCAGRPFGGPFIFLSVSVGHVAISKFLDDDGAKKKLPPRGTSSARQHRKVRKTQQEAENQLLEWMKESSSHFLEKMGTRFSWSLRSKHVQNGICTCTYHSSFLEVYYHFCFQYIVTMV